MAHEISKSTPKNPRKNKQKKTNKYKHKKHYESNSKETFPRNYTTIKNKLNLKLVELPTLDQRLPWKERSIHTHNMIININPLFVNPKDRILKIFCEDERVLNWSPLKSFQKKNFYGPHISCFLKTHKNNLIPSPINRSNHCMLDHIKSLSMLRSTT